MNTIRNYINAMFSSLPRIPEILRLQTEMLENMEEKYNDLLREGKSEAEAVGIVLSSIGSAEDLRAELGISEEDPYTQPQEDHSAFLAERAAFQKKFAIAIPCAVVLCICGVIAGAVCDSLTKNDGITSIAFFSPIAVAVAIFIYFGMRNDWYDTQYKEFYHLNGSDTLGNQVDSNEKTLSGLVSSIIFPLAVVVYLFIGLMFHLWHPGWIIFLLCWGIVASVEAYEKYKKQQ
ncbi:MAG: permease prefix domain 1-containing protein [Eubacteriales bacterium]|nr:permease prefix domain 1-containing protein [Eubacteriales bacterium]